MRAQQEQDARDKQKAAEAAKNPLGQDKQQSGQYYYEATPTCLGLSLSAEEPKVCAAHAHDRESHHTCARPQRRPIHHSRA